MTQTYSVMKEAEPFYFSGNQTGILVQHGFTGTTQSMRPLGDHLAKCGYTVYGPRLKGHGTHYEELEGTTYQDWVQSAEAGYRKLKETCTRVFVVGLSMGGTLALHLAHRFSETRGIVLINAALEITDLDQLIALEEPRFLDAIGSDIKAEGIEELAYEKIPLKSVKEFAELARRTREKVPSISCPALILVSREDHVVPPANSRWIDEQLRSEDKRLVELEESYHVATLDNDRERIQQATEAFIRNRAQA